ncbi:MAG: flagellar export protein FliJ [Gammaproteobacteria bacterium]
MARRNRIETLQRLAGHTEAESARRLAERLRALDTEERRLQQIRTYLAEYSTGGNTGSAMTIGSLRSGRGFLERLREAVDAQRGTVETQRQQVEHQTIQWRAARTRTRSLEKLRERQLRDEREVHDRREQVRLDEIAISRSLSSRKV